LHFPASNVLCKSDNLAKDIANKGEIMIAGDSEEGEMIYR